MSKIRKGDIVGRKSYNKDIYFLVNNIIEKTDEKIAILNGLVERIEADSPVSDLEIIPKNEVKKRLENLNNKLEKRVFISEEKRSNIKDAVSNGKLRYSGDRRRTCRD